MNFLLRTERLLASLSGKFGGLAALLAIIGLYGVMAYVALPALALVNLVRSQLFGLGPRDPLTFIGSAIVLTFAAGLTRLARKRRRSDNRTPA